MVVTSTQELGAETVSNYDRKSELMAFDDSKAGVQGLVENGVAKVPRMFYYEHANDLSDGLASASNSKISIPVIDLTGIRDDPNLRDDVVRKVRYACEKWGFFQVINHGIPTHVLDEMIKGTGRFHQQDAEVRKEYYTRDFSRKVAYLSNYTLYEDPSADWRDTIAFSLAPDHPKAEEFPAVCRDIVIEYSKKIMVLAYALFELLSEALGLDHFYLKEKGCAQGLLLLCNYYPACPEPGLTMGNTKHSDGDVMTILLQDQMGGLQFLHDSQWIDVPPMHEALVVNIGDLLQLMTNDKFISVQHRVLAKHQGPRISVASFFRTGISKVFGPIEELCCEDHPPAYREISLKDYMAHRYASGSGTSALLHFKL